MMFLKFIKRFKEEKKQLEDDYSKSSMENKALAQEQIGMVRMKMLNIQCPINNNDKCTEFCIHFNEGHVSFWSWFEGTRGEWVKIYPRCKLWSSQ